MFYQRQKNKMKNESSTVRSHSENVFERREHIFVAQSVLNFLTRGRRTTMQGFACKTKFSEAGGGGQSEKKNT